jgi:cytoskeletal protein CcmA (bactofilin family)
LPALTNPDHTPGARRGLLQENGKTRAMFALARRPTVPTGELPVSHLERALTVQGRLESIGEVHIHGTIKGRIDADRLVIAADGSVEGDIVANDVRIAGRMNGRIFALNVTLEMTAKVAARIFHNSVTIANGARFEGRMPWRPPQFFESLEQLPETQP